MGMQEFRQALTKQSLEIAEDYCNNYGIDTAEGFEFIHDLVRSRDLAQVRMGMSVEAYEDWLIAALDKHFSPAPPDDDFIIIAMLEVFMADLETRCNSGEDVSDLLEEYNNTKATIERICDKMNYNKEEVLQALTPGRMLQEAFAELQA